MALPYTFISGTIAKSSEVNANFDYIINVIGDLVGPDRIATLKEFLMGQSSQVLFTAASQHYFQLGWNADYNHLGGGVFAFSRFVADKNATALRLGKDGAEIMLTSATSGNLDKQMDSVWAIRATTGADYMYFKSDWHIQQKDGTATKLDDYRLTYVPLQTSRVIYSNQPLTDGKTVTMFGYKDQNIPKEAKVIKITAWIRAGGSDAELRFYPAGVDRVIYNGVSVSADAGKVGSGCFDLNLGTGSHSNQYVLTAVGSIAQATAAVVGYWI